MYAIKTILPITIVCVHDMPYSCLLAVLLFCRSESRIGTTSDVHLLGECMETWSWYALPKQLVSNCCMHMVFKKLISRIKSDFVLLLIMSMSSTRTRTKHIDKNSFGFIIIACSWILASQSLTHCGTCFHFVGDAGNFVSGTMMLPICDVAIYLS